MKVSKRAAVAAALVAAAGAAIPSFAASGNGTHGSNSVACGGGQVTYDPTTVFPPNHKMQTINISYVSDNQNPTEDTSYVTVTAITHDQFLSDGTEMNGSGHTLVDWEGVGNSNSAPKGSAATTTAGIRAERSGQDQSGRTYKITVTCDDENKNAPGISDDRSMADLYVTVPHDQGVSDSKTG